MQNAILETTVLDRMERAVMKVRERLLRASSALDRAEIPYVVIGGNAVAAWVARIDESAVRNTQDVDILIRRSDLDAVKETLEKEGFIYRHSAGIDMFLDGPGSKARDAVHVIFAGKKVRQEYVEPAPEPIPFDIAPPFRLLPLEALVRMKLTSFRDKDRVHLRDFADVGLIDFTWPDRFQPILADRLRAILADPDG